MTANTAPKSALDGLAKCGLCGASMSVGEPAGHKDPLYLCARNNCHNEVQAPATDHLIIASVLEAVLTGMALQTVENSIREMDAQDGVGSTFPIEDIALLREDPYLFLRAVRGVENARNFLATFIEHINLFTDRALVQYALPLPPDSPLAGAKEQEIRL